MSTTRPENAPKKGSKRDAVKHFFSEGRTKILIEATIPLLFLLAAGYEEWFDDGESTEEILWTGMSTSAVLRWLSFWGIFENYSHSKKWRDGKGEDGNCDCERDRVD